jgi:hypothetical protein
MARSSKILAILALLAIPLCGAGASAAAAQGENGGGNQGIGTGILTDNASTATTGHSAQCGNPVALFSPATCTTDDQHAGHDKPGSEDIGGGLLTGVLSWNSTGHSNNCGNGLIELFNQTNCVTEQQGH